MGSFARLPKAVSTLQGKTIKGVGLTFIEEEDLTVLSLTFTDGTSLDFQSYSPPERRDFTTRPNAEGAVKTTKRKTAKQQRLRKPTLS